MRALPLLLLASLAAPAMAQDAGDAYAQAVAARQSGDPARAAELLEPWVATHPADNDARVQLGYALLALGRLDGAEAQFRAVLAAAPDYADARDGLALVERRRAPGAETRQYLLLEGSISDIDASPNGWREFGLSGVVALGGADTLQLGGSWYRRFGLEDVEGRALYSFHPAADTWLRIGASATPSAEFRPEIGLEAGIDQRVKGGADATVLGFDASWRRFPLQDVWTFSPAVTQYFAQGRASVTARANAVVAEGDAMRIGGMVRLGYEAGENARLFIGGAMGPETDLGVVSDTSSLFGGGEIGLGGALSLTGSIAREWRDGPADRTELRLGLKVAL